MIARHFHAPTVALVLLLAGCEGTFTNDLATEPPADPEIAEVRVGLLGLEFEASGGGTRTLDFRDAEAVDLLELAATGRDAAGGLPMDGGRRVSATPLAHTNGWAVRFVQGV